MRRGLWALLAAAVLAGTGPAAAGARPLETAVFPDEQSSSRLAHERIADAGATKVRLILDWRRTAPAARPASFDPANPGDPAYRWAEFDAQVGLAAEAGLDPIVSVFNAPAWASGSSGIERPSPVQLATFARAAARRYSGNFEGLPRVRYWQVWNEPNLSAFLAPQLVGGKPFSPGLYRRMANQFYDAVKSVRRDNVVVAGGTAPFRDTTVKSMPWGPLTFMRELLCLSRSLAKKCSARTAFDVWAHHPYTSGGPTRKAQLADDVSLGDLPDMRRVLEAARRAGTIRSARAPLFWVTEFSWDSAPPDPKGVPTALQARWVAEGLYEMWKAGVSLVTWFLIRDEPMGSSYFQSGLYFRGATLAQDRPKPALAAFRFPFVAYKQGSGLRYWGRTPAGKPGRVVVEQRTAGGWRRLTTVTANRHGIFQGRQSSRAGEGAVRARLATGDAAARPFSLARPPDRFYCAFGGC